jgi:septal ring-binding cell division protein DamX
MKFIKLESRGGNYLVVAENVAWLRSAENGQTNVGIVGGQPLLVIGSIEDVAAKILAGAAEGEEPVATQVAAPTVIAPVAPAEPAPTPEPAHDPAPSAPEPKAAPEAEAPAPARRAAAQTPAAMPANERPHPVVKPGMTLSERVAAAAAPKVKAGTQRYMGSLE